MRSIKGLWGSFRANGHIKIDLNCIILPYLRIKIPMVKKQMQSGGGLVVAGMNVYSSIAILAGSRSEYF